MPATVWTSVVSWVLEDGRRRAEGAGSRKRHTGVEQLVPPVTMGTLLTTITNLSACAAMSGMPRPAGLHKLRSKKMSSQVTAASALVEAGILAALDLEEFGHDSLLVRRARKVEREAASGDFRRDLGIVACRATDASDVGTCETKAIW